MIGFRPSPWSYIIYKPQLLPELIANVVESTTNEQKLHFRMSCLVDATDPVGDEALFLFFALFKIAKRRLLVAYPLVPRQQLAL
jgi:hypothetical protein